MGVFFTRNSSFRNSSLGNFRLGILNSGNFRLGILEFPTMSSPDLTRGISSQRILEFPIEILWSSWGMTQKAKLRDDREFRIPKDKFRIHRDCSLFFQSLAITEFLQ